MNRVNDILTALKAAGLAAYPPAVKSGVCTSPYCVVQQCGAYLRAETRRGGYCRYRVHLFAPLDDYEGLDVLAESVVEALGPMEESGALRLDRPRSETAVSDEFRAHGCYIEFVSFFTFEQK
ncbi:MAG: hypothetical protein FWE86_04845 [Oscillospiraceae bacterium]|nr:hypothetical protein [Oscillospiraceae bacterium]